MNIDEIRELILLLNETDVGELEIETDSFRISLRKGVSENGPSNGNRSKLSKKDKDNDVAQEKVEVNENLVEVQAPMVGTFYAAPSPDSAPYVKIGDHVEKGQTLCIVEAMKLMNEIKAEVSGKIVDILVENAEPVEYGQPIFLIEKD
ncbi:MAG: acetyl-CoA carboxylase biotin carboxyl carrier protein [Syntrophomonadaceae bacterium]|nr:acetyl-CoA carboxylase biotin carboxyl carrier protein [Syntrophomonadaceae bacterium]